MVQVRMKCNPGPRSVSYFNAKKVLPVKLQDNNALITTRGMNIGFFKNTPFNSGHWVTNIYKNENGKWTCVMAQESAVSCD